MRYNHFDLVYYGLTVNHYNQGKTLELWQLYVRGSRVGAIPTPSPLNLNKGVVV